jgi:hypothetical protein
MKNKQIILDELYRNMRELIELIGSNSPNRLADILAVAIEELDDITSDSVRLVPLLRLCETLHKIQLIEGLGSIE